MNNIRTRLYRGGTLASSDFPVMEISELMKEKDTAIWVDFVSPSEDQLLDIAEELDLHELAVEDALHPHQRPKVDYYPTHLFLASHAITLSENGTIDVTEVDAFVKGQCLVTVRKGTEFSMDKVVERWSSVNNTQEVEISFLLYGLLDVIIDGYVDIVEHFDDYYDEVSEGIFSETPLDPMQQKLWFNMRRSLVQFHRTILSMREAINILLRREHNLISPEMVPYFHDLFDHLIRVSESTDTLRDLAATIVDTNINLRDYRQNQIMKKVTSWAAILAVPTLITGFYGMNVPFPGNAEHNGVIASSLLIAIISIALYFTFRKKDWL